MPSDTSRSIDERDIGQVDNAEGEIELGLEGHSISVHGRGVFGIDRRIDTFRFFGTVKVTFVSACFRSIVFEKQAQVSWSGREE